MFVAISMVSVRGGAGGSRVGSLAPVERLGLAGAPLLVVALVEASEGVSILYLREESTAKYG
jgi:hypothetical protein